jgi:hypothetical protein
MFFINLGILPTKMHDGRGRAERLPGCNALAAAG